MAVKAWWIWGLGAIGVAIVGLLAVIAFALLSEDGGGPAAEVAHLTPAATTTPAATATPRPTPTPMPPTPTLEPTPQPIPEATAQPTEEPSPIQEVPPPPTEGPPPVTEEPPASTEEPPPSQPTEEPSTPTSEPPPSVCDGLPTYSEVVAAYPPGVVLTDGEFTILEAVDEDWLLSGHVDVRDGKALRQWYGVKTTVGTPTPITINGVTYQPGDKLTVDKDLSYVLVCSWD